MLFYFWKVYSCYILAIKIGRYTIGRKRQNDQEVKQLSATIDKQRLDSESSKSSGSPYSPG